MKTKLILFDLDGTLLPMDQDEYVNAYFGAMVDKLTAHGYERAAVAPAIWGGTKAMITHTSGERNDKVFWDYFTGIFGERVSSDMHVFDDFYANDFDSVSSSCSYTPLAKKLIERVRELGFRTVLATNPVFPAVATEKRIKWAGISPSDFEFFTSYENSHYCKPNLDYYREILEKANITPQECLMVGNDVGEDMVCLQLGMKVFLLTDCLINKSGADISKYPHGSFEELTEFIENLN